MSDVHQYRPVSTSEAIGLLYSHVIPVSPVHPVLEHCQREHVWNGTIEHHVAITAVKVGESGSHTGRFQLQPQLIGFLSLTIYLV